MYIINMVNSINKLISHICVAYVTLILFYCSTQVLLSLLKDKDR